MTVQPCFSYFQMATPAPSTHAAGKKHCRSLKPPFDGAMREASVWRHRRRAMLVGRHHSFSSSRASCSGGRCCKHESHGIARPVFFQEQYLVVRHLRKKNVLTCVSAGRVSQRPRRTEVPVIFTPMSIINNSAMFRESCQINSRVWKDGGRTDKYV